MLKYIEKNEIPSNSQIENGKRKNIYRCAGKYTGTTDILHYSIDNK